MKLLIPFIDRWVPPALQADAVACTRARLVLMLGLVAASAGLPVAGLFACFGSVQGGAVILLGAACMVVSAMAMRLIGKAGPSAFLGIAIMYLVVVYIALATSDRAELAPLEWFSLVPVVATFVNGRRSGLRWGAAAFLGALLLAMRPLRDAWPMPVPAAHPEVLVTVLRLAFILVIAFMAALFQLSREALEGYLVRWALLDPLTGLPNRRHLELSIKAAIDRSQRSEASLALLYLDLDGFKAINDQHGHGVGDEVLKGFAVRLRESVRASDMVVRLGGDEFVVMLDCLRERSAAEGVAAKVLAAMRQPLLVGPRRQVILVGTSIGIAFTGPESAGLEQLLVDADRALYEAKQDGRGRYAIGTAR